MISRRLRNLSKVSATAGTVVLSVGLLVSSNAAWGEDERSAPIDIQEYMTYHLGRWQSTTTYFDADGNATKEEVEGSGERVLLSDQVNLHFSYNADGSTNTAFRFHSPEDDTFYMIDVTHEGRWWVLTQERESEFMYSNEKELVDGRKVTLRIKHFNIRPAAFEATVDVSFDSGETWRLMSHQDYRKIGNNPDR